MNVLCFRKRQYDDQSAYGAVIFGGWFYTAASKVKEMDDLKMYLTVRRDHCTKIRDGIFIA